MVTTDIASLKAAFEAANAYNDWSTAVVVLGLVVEFVALLFFSKDMSHAEKALLVAGSIMVAFGVGGEYVFSGRAAKAAIALQQASDEKIAGLKRDQEADHKAATQAVAYAARLGMSVGTLHDFVTEEEAKIGRQMTDFTAYAQREKSETDDAVKHLQTDTAALDKARADAEETEKKAETVVAAALARETQRTLRPEQRNAIVAAVSPFKGQKVTVACVVTDEESCRYAAYFLDALKDAHWDLGDKPSVSHAIFVGGQVGVFGVQLTLNDDDLKTRKLPAGANALYDILVRLNLSDRTAYVDPGVPTGALQLKVGPRPPLPAQ